MLPTTIMIGSQMKSPYEILGVAKTASPDEIKKAFRKRAKTMHPDLNPGDKKAEERFKELSLANEILSDPDKRRRFDAGEIDSTGADVPRPQYYKDYADNPARGHAYDNRSGFADFGDIGGLFEQMRAQQAERARNAPGGDIHYSLTVDFLDAVNGTTKQVSVGQGETLSLKIPPGSSNEDVLRIPGKGHRSAGTGRPGDALVSIYVRPHRFFTRIDNDIHLELPVTIKEAVLGGKVKVPTPSGAVMLNIPKGSGSGTKLRIRGKGVAGKVETGDEIVTLKIVVPAKDDPALNAFLAGWEPADSASVRKDMTP